jgi:hypothetical protein
LRFLRCSIPGRSIEDTPKAASVAYVSNFSFGLISFHPSVSLSQLTWSSINVCFSGDLFQAFLALESSPVFASAHRRLPTWSRCRGSAMHAKLDSNNPSDPSLFGRPQFLTKADPTDGDVLLLRIAALVLSLVVLITPSLAWLCHVMLDLQSCHVSDAGQQIQSRTDTDWLLL